MNNKLYIIHRIFKIFKYYGKYHQLIDILPKHYIDYNHIYDNMVSTIENNFKYVNKHYNQDNLKGTYTFPFLTMIRIRINNYDFCRGMDYLLWDDDILYEWYKSIKCRIN